MLKLLPLAAKLAPALIAVALFFSLVKTGEKIGELKLENRQIKTQTDDCQKQLNSYQKQLNKQEKKEERRKK